MPFKEMRSWSIITSNDKAIKYMLIIEKDSLSILLLNTTHLLSLKIKIICVYHPCTAA
jgi:hypothetical protein